MIILIMGVSGSGKTQIAQLLAQSLHWEFQDADDFHPPSNIEKMSRGIPLNDADRMPWLEALKQLIQGWLISDHHYILACSALKEAYRQFLWCDPKLMRLVYLKGSFELIETRLNQRQFHFMQSNLLQSQFEALQEPREGLYVDAGQPPEVIVDVIQRYLGL